MVGYLIIRFTQHHLNQMLPFAQHEFSIGLAIFSVVPTTLGAGVAFTQASRRVART